MNDFHCVSNAITYNDMLTYIVATAGTVVVVGFATMLCVVFYQVATTKR